MHKCRMDIGTARTSRGFFFIWRCTLGEIDPAIVFILLVLACSCFSGGRRGKRRRGR